GCQRLAITTLCGATPAACRQRAVRQLGGTKDMDWKLIGSVLMCSIPLFATAGSFDDALRKLEPEERSHQACIIKGLDILRPDARLRGADRLKTSILSPP